MQNTRVGKLKSLIYEKFSTETDCAKALGWKKQKLNRISNGISRPDVDEINALSKTLEKPIEEIIHIFINN